MKTLIVVFLLFVTTNLFAQDFSLSTFAGSGVKLPGGIYQASLQVTPQFAFDKFTIEQVNKSIMIDSLTLFQFGARAGYQFWTDDNNKTLHFTAHYLYGSDNSQIVGCGVGYQVNLLRLNTEFGYDTKTSDKYLEFNVGLMISE